MLKEKLKVLVFLVAFYTLSFLFGAGITHYYHKKEIKSLEQELWIAKQGKTVLKEKGCVYELN